MDHPSELAVADPITGEELALASRNHGLPLEALHYSISPVGLHYVLIHYDIPLLDTSFWRLEIEGLVRRPKTWTLQELRRYPAVTAAVTMECAGNGRAFLHPRPLSQPWLHEAVGTGQWRGVPLDILLNEVGLQSDACEVVFTGADRGVEGGTVQNYERSLPLDVALTNDVFIAYELNGAPLPPQHGFPARLIVPGWYGMTNVKWLQRISVVREPFAGYQQTNAYRMRRDSDEPGAALDRMAPRALMIPPGIPSFPERRRTLPIGACRLEGRAWSGQAPIERVEVSTDGAATWTAARVDPTPGPGWTWRRWTFDWRPSEAGDYLLCCRATDTAHHSQPLDPIWNLGGYANNAVQKVAVTVSEDAPAGIRPSRDLRAGASEPTKQGDD